MKKFVFPLSGNGSIIETRERIGMTFAAGNKPGRMEKSGKKTNTKENLLLGKLKFKPINLGNLKF